MNITQMLLTPNKHSRPQTPLNKITKVVWHYVGNPKSTAKNNRDYFENLKAGLRDGKGNYLYVSAHYIVGLEGEIIQCIPENEIAYCSNSANGYSISIETCHPDSTGKFNAATEKALIELTADICKRHGLDPMKDIIRHHDVTGKLCPLWYVNHPNDFLKAKQAVDALTETKPQIKKLWIGRFTAEQRAQIVCDFLNACGMYTEQPKQTGEEWFLISYTYTGEKEIVRAKEISKALQGVFGIYSELQSM